MHATSVRLQAQLQSLHFRDHAPVFQMFLPGQQTLAEPLPQRLYLPVFSFDLELPKRMLEILPSLIFTLLEFQAVGLRLELKESEDQARQYFQHALWKLEIERKNREIKSLGERLGKGLLTREEHLE